jgi:hypothetical protein
MLTITGSKSSRFCDGFVRGDFLKIGALGGMLTLADKLRLHAQRAERAARPSRSKSAIVTTGSASPQSFSQPCRPNDVHRRRPRANFRTRRAVGQRFDFHKIFGGVEYCKCS